MRIKAVAFAGLLLASCSAGQIGMPASATVLPESQIAAMLRQCSRASPLAGQAGWRPSAGDILELERRLPAAIAAAPEARDMLEGRPPEGWLRQYVGLVRDGRRYIYGNYSPARGGFGGDWRRTPMIVCDGGPDFFGVEYDVEGRRFTHLAFNGVA
ncbi:MAG: hypothetical protein EON89_01155 [Brevundimonas sp.]|nr:MAG: hypothetical protein EON89_01155 [Brevundimonas sp.]